MTYNDEQRAIIQRMGELSIRIRAAEDADRAAHAAASGDIAGLMGHLIDSNARLGEIVRLNREYGDAFREFLDTL